MDNALRGHLNVRMGLQRVCIAGLYALPDAFGDIFRTPASRSSAKSKLKKEFGGHAYFEVDVVFSALRHLGVTIDGDAWNAYASSLTRKPKNMSSHAKS